MLVRFLRRPSAEWLLVLGLAFLAALALVHMSIALPYQCHVKAFYGLCALVPLCAFGALRRRRSVPVEREAATGDLRSVWRMGHQQLCRVVDFTLRGATLRSRAHSLWNEDGSRKRWSLLSQAGTRPEPKPEAQSFLAYLLMETGEVHERHRAAQNRRAARTRTSPRRTWCSPPS